MLPSSPLRTLERLVLVAVGGFVGSNLRYLVDLLVPGAVGTLVVNGIGSVLLGALLYAGLYAGTLSRETRTVLAAGLLASFTTYSTFALETAQAAGPAWMAANVIGSYTVGFTGVLVGRTLARRLVGGTTP